MSQPGRRADVTAWSPCRCHSLVAVPMSQPGRRADVTAWSPCRCHSLVAMPMSQPGHHADVTAWSPCRCHSLVTVPMSQPGRRADVTAWSPCRCHSLVAVPDGQGPVSLSAHIIYKWTGNNASKYTRNSYLRADMRYRSLYCWSEPGSQSLGRCHMALWVETIRWYTHTRSHTHTLTIGCSRLRTKLWPSSESPSPIWLSTSCSVNRAAWPGPSRHGQDWTQPTIEAPNRSRL